MFDCRWVGVQLAKELGCLSGYGVTSLFQCDLSNDTTQPYEYYGSTKFPNEVLLDKDINKAVKEKYKAMRE